MPQHNMSVVDGALKVHGMQRLRVADGSSEADMSEPVERDDALTQLDRVVGLGEPLRVGWFRFFLDGQRWEWSDAVAGMHGYEPGTVVPDTELLISHKHPDDRERAINRIKRVLAGKPFSSRHRIIDTAEHTYWVVVVGGRMLDETGTVIGTRGFFVDVTETLQSDITHAVTQVAAAPADIEQAKGVLMVTYGITAERAFDILVLALPANQHQGP